MRPAREERYAPGLSGAATRPAAMDAEDVDVLASLLQVHDPRLGLLDLKPELGQDRRERHKGVSASRLVLHNPAVDIEQQ